MTDSNLPAWPGASACYSKAYAYMERYGPNHDLIEALSKGDEEYIKWALLEYNERTLRERGDLPDSSLKRKGAKS